jgi:hypothetical protein
MDTNAQLDTDQQLNEVVAFVKAHEVTADLWVHAGQIRPFAVERRQGGVDFGSCLWIPTNGAQATIILQQRGLLVGQGIIYLVQEVWNVTVINVKAGTRHAALSGTNTDANRDQYAMDVERLEFGAFPYRYKMADAMDRDAATKRPEGESWQEYNYNIKPADFDAYIKFVSSEHTDRYRQDFDDGFTTRGRLAHGINVVKKKFSKKKRV